MKRKEKKELIYEGKVKSIWSTEDEDRNLIEFKDILFDEINQKEIAVNKKGFYNAKISYRLFEYMYGYWVNNYAIDFIEPNLLFTHRITEIPYYFRIYNKATEESKAKLNAEVGDNLKAPFFEIIHKETNSSIPEEQFVDKDFFKDVPFFKIKQLLLKSNSVFKTYFTRRGHTLYDIRFELGILDNKPVFVDEISPDTFTVANTETEEFIGKYAVVFSNRNGADAYEDAYKIVFQEEFQPEFERIKVVDDYIPEDEFSEFEDDIDLAQAENLVKS